MTPEEVRDLLAYLTPEEREEAERLLYGAHAPVWVPLPGPQLDAFNSGADITGYGGAAGGGKTDLAVGLATTQHQRVLMLRREKAQTQGIVQRMEEVLGHKAGYNGQLSTWRLPGGLVEFGGLDNLGDERRWQGRPHDLIVYDEVTEIREGQARFCMGWLRSSDPRQRARVLMTFNPPTSAEGQWVLKYFGPWLDSRHPNPAKPGELRWFTTLAGQDVEVDDPHPFTLADQKKTDERTYDYPPDTPPEHIITPRSRTFIPARVTDNPYYMETGYLATLQGLPEPLRSMMLNGDFGAGLEDDRWQVIPTAWVEIAMARWKPRDSKGEMDSMGVDVARGGRDKHIIARRHCAWFDELVKYPGDEVHDGPTGAGLVIQHRRSACPVHVDVIGWGASVHDFLTQSNVQSLGINATNKSYATSQQGGLPFLNVRAELYWMMREALDPANDRGVALPPDDDLKKDLTSATWKLSGGKIQVESKEDIKKRIGRSPDCGDAVLLANIETVPTARDPRNVADNPRRGYDPLNS